MRPIRVAAALVAGTFATVYAVTSCAPLNDGVPGDPAVTRPELPGTIFTIVFENENSSEILTPSTPTFYALSQAYGTADAYISNDHPSLTNYMVMTSGETHGIRTGGDPPNNVIVDGAAHLGAQLDAAGVTWRAYMESMEEPCRLDSTELYAARHNPFVYYQSLTSNPERCREHVVDFERHFTEDLAADAYRFMWITPNMCNDIHDCPKQIGDAWLARVSKQIMESPGYKRGGALFILFDEGPVRIFKAAANLPTVIVSPLLVAPGYRTDTRFDHRSYLATIQDIFRLPRLPTTETAAPMSEFFATPAAL